MPSARGTRLEFPPGAGCSHTLDRNFSGARVWRTLLFVPLLMAEFSISSPELTIRYVPWGASLNPLSSWPSFCPQHRRSPSVPTAQVNSDPALTDWYRPVLMSGWSSESHAAPANKASAPAITVRSKLFITAPQSAKVLASGKWNARADPLGLPVRRRPLTQAEFNAPASPRTRQCPAGKSSRHTPGRRG